MAQGRPRPLPPPRAPSGPSLGATILAAAVGRLEVIARADPNVRAAAEGVAVALAGAAILAPAVDALARGLGGRAAARAAARAFVSHSDPLADFRKRK